MVFFVGNFSGGALPSPDQIKEADEIAALENNLKTTLVRWIKEEEKRMTYSNLKNNVDRMVVFPDDLEGDVHAKGSSIWNRPDGKEGETGGRCGKKIYMHQLFEVQKSALNVCNLWFTWIISQNTRPVSRKGFRREAVTNLFLGGDLNPKQRVDSMYRMNSIRQCFQTLKVECTLYICWKEKWNVKYFSSSELCAMCRWSEDVGRTTGTSLGATGFQRGRVEELKMRGKDEFRRGCSSTRRSHGRERERFFSFWIVGTMTSVADVHIATFSSFSSISATMKLSKMARLVRAEWTNTSGEFLSRQSVRQDPILSKHVFRM